MKLPYILLKAHRDNREVNMLQNLTKCCKHGKQIIVRYSKVYIIRAGLYAGTDQFKGL